MKEVKTPSTQRLIQITGTRHPLPLPMRESDYYQARAQSYHILHAYVDISLAVEGSVEADYVRGVTLMQDLQLSHDGLPYLWLYLQVNQL